MHLEREVAGCKAWAAALALVLVPVASLVQVGHWESLGQGVPPEEGVGAAAVNRMEEAPQACRWEGTRRMGAPLLVVEHRRAPQTGEVVAAVAAGVGSE